MSLLKMTLVNRCQVLKRLFVELYNRERFHIYTGIDIEQFSLYYFNTAKNLQEYNSRNLELTFFIRFFTLELIDVSATISPSRGEFDQYFIFKIEFKLKNV